MKRIFKGLHPNVWKDVLTQIECTRFPFKLNVVRNLEESEVKPLFVKGIQELLAQNLLWQESKVLIMDDTYYKNMLSMMICLPTFEPMDASQLPHPNSLVVVEGVECSYIS